MGSWWIWVMLMWNFTELASILYFTYHVYFNCILKFPKLEKNWANQKGYADKNKARRGWFQEVALSTNSQHRVNIQGTAESDPQDKNCQNTFYTRGRWDRAQATCWRFHNCDLRANCPKAPLLKNQLGLSGRLYFSREITMQVFLQILKLYQLNVFWNNLFWSQKLTSIV